MKPFLGIADRSGSIADLEAERRRRLTRRELASESVGRVEPACTCTTSELDALGCTCPASHKETDDAIA